MSLRERTDRPGERKRNTFGVKGQALTPVLRDSSPSIHLCNKHFSSATLRNSSKTETPVLLSGCSRGELDGNKWGSPSLPAFPSSLSFRGSGRACNPAPANRHSAPFHPRG